MHKQEIEQQRFDKIAKIFEKEYKSYSYNKLRDELLNQQKQDSLHKQVEHELKISVLNDEKLNETFRNQQKSEQKFHLEQLRRQNIFLENQKQKIQRLDQKFERQNSITGNFREMQRRQNEISRQLDELLRQNQQNKLDQYNKMKMSKTLQLSRQQQDLQLKTSQMRSRTQTQQKQFADQTLNSINQTWYRTSKVKQQFYDELNDRALAQYIKDINDIYDQKIAELKFKYDIFY